MYGLEDLLAQILGINYCFHGPQATLSDNLCRDFLSHAFLTARFLHNRLEGCPAQFII